ncbi:MAG: cyanophycin synthetase [Desulfitobacteriaceae bacterium]
MEIKQIQAIEGANVFSYKPIIRVVLDLQDWAEKTSDQLGDFNVRLVESMPGLSEHYCSRGKPGGFLERLEEGTLLGHIIEHVTIEILTLAGQTIPYGKTMSLLSRPGEYEIIFNYESKEGAMEAFRQAVRMVEGLLDGQRKDVEGIVQRLKGIIAVHELGLSTQAIIGACQQRGIPVQRLNEYSLLQLGYGRNQRRVQATMTDQTSCVGVDIACDKGLTKRLLHEAGIPVPYGQVARNEDEAVLAFRDIGRAVVVKPYNGNQGKGVTLSLKSEAEVQTAFRVAQTYGDEVIVEEYIEGHHYRLLVVDGRLVAAAERIPAHVIGDGYSTIEQLVEQANQDPLRGEDHEKALTKIKIDPVVILTLAQKKLTLASVPATKEVVYLRDSANLSTGGIAEDMTDRVHPDNSDLAVYAARVVGLDIAGVDLVIEDISASYRKANGRIVEVNAAPGIRMHHFPSVGKAREVGKTVADLVLPKGNGRIPIVAITGTNGKTTTTRMIGNMLSHQQLQVGMTTTDGIYVNGKLLVEGDTTGPGSARVILRHPDVQVAVLETARGGILRAGLAYDYADVAVITNVSADHLGQDGVETIEDLVHVKSLVAEVVKPHSYVVLNADDPYVVPMARKTKGKVIFFSIHKDNIHVRKHLGRGGTAVFIRRGMILLCQGSRSYKICSVRQLPITLGGRAVHNVQNVLAAAAVGWALGLSAGAISVSLGNFLPNEVDSRGRLNCYDIDGISVWVDYGHNAAGIQEIVRTLKKYKAACMVGCITVPGDRTDKAIMEVARVAAKGFQRLIIREDEDLRGRKPGEVARILYAGAVAAGMAPNRITVILAEREAFRYGLDTCSPGEMFVMFYEHLDSIEEEVRFRLARDLSKDAFEQSEMIIRSISGK